MHYFHKAKMSIHLSTQFDKNAPLRPAFRPIPDYAVPIYSQFDTRWALHPYRKMKNVSCGSKDTSTIATSGCGAVSTSMLINYWAKQGKCPPASPHAIADFFTTYGGRICNNGTGYSQVPKTLFQNTFGVKILTTKATDSQIMTALRKGYPCIVSGKSYTGLNFRGEKLSNRYGGGHYVVLTGIDSSNRIRVNDSGNSPTGGRAITAFLPGHIPSQARTPTSNIIMYPISMPSPLS